MKWKSTKSTKKNRVSLPDPDWDWCGVILFFFLQIRFGFMPLSNLIPKVLRLVCVVAFLSCLGCAVSKSAASHANQSLTYPMWFWQPPISQNLPVAVGYAPAYYRDESSQQAAIDDAVQQLAKQMQVGISGERIIIDRRQAEKFDEIVPPDMLNLVLDSHVVLATHQMPEQFLVLLGMGEVKLNRKLVLASSRSKPDWLSQLPESTASLYGVGHCSRPSLRLHSGWREAERNALVDLALTLKSYVRNLTKQLNSQTGRVLSVQTNVVLSRIQVVERWYDRQNRSYHVLMEMPLKSNQSAVRQMLEKLVQQAETPPERSIQEIID